MSVYSGNDLFYILLVLIFAFGSCSTMTTTFSSWEHCYEEDASPITLAHSAHLQIVRSVTNKLGVQFWSEIEYLEKLENATMKLKVWEEKDGSNTKFQLSDICKFNQFRDKSKECNLEGRVKGMLETLIPEVASRFEAEFQIFSEIYNPETGTTTKEELVCLLINFTLSESDLQLFLKQRNQGVKEL